MKKVELKPWQLYTLTFVVLFGVNVGLRWMSFDKEWKDGNLLVNLAVSALLTCGFMIGDRQRRKNKEYKDKVEDLLKNNK